MLGQQAATLEDQARLFNQQVVQQKNEILKSELDFYNHAFNTIATSASVLAGFAFSGLQMSQDDIFYRGSVRAHARAAHVALKTFAGRGARRPARALSTCPSRAARFLLSLSRSLSSPSLLGFGVARFPPRRSGSSSSSCST